MISLARLKERVEKATAGPWTGNINNQIHTPEFQMSTNRKATDIIAIVSQDYGSNTEFIAHARTDIPKLIEVIELLAAACEFALIYNPDTDHYKIKHTAYPKLKEALELTAKKLESVG